MFIRALIKRINFILILVRSLMQKNSIKIGHAACSKKKKGF